MQRGELVAGRYELVERLGRGGMGDVWAGRDRTLRRDVAVKLLVLDATVPPDLPHRFEREAVAAAQINHPNVVALHDFGVHEDLLYLVMERVEGATLAAHLGDRGPMEPARALEVAQQICEALAAAHRARVIHYDIKPHNVMLTRDGRVKVVDFGIAGFVHLPYTLVPSEQLAPAGTPEYGAPEQFLTERGDERSDLYALGSVLFALLTGRPPVTGPNGYAVMRRKLDEEAPSLGTFRPDLPPDLIRLVADLLRRDPARRPPTAEAVEYRLRRLRATTGAPGTSGTAGDTGERTRTPTGTHTRRIPTSGTPNRTPVPTSSRTPTPTEPIRPGEEPFDITWSVKDRSTVGPRPRYGPALACAWIVALVLATAVLSRDYFPPDGAALRKAYEEDDDPVLGTVFLLVVALSIATVTTVAGALRRRLRNGRATAWSLRIGPQGIVTTDASAATTATGPTGRHAIAWDRVRMVTLEDVRAGVPRRSTGLHVRFTPDAPAQAPGRPAGWNGPLPLRPRADGSVPLCVLGPLTAEQRSALTDALGHYAGPRWRPEIGRLGDA